MRSKSGETKEKFDKKAMKIYGMKKMFANYVSDEGFISKIRKQYFQLRIKLKVA
jgi:hypothetical protein